MKERHRFINILFFQYTLKLPFMNRVSRSDFFFNKKKEKIINNYYYKLYRHFINKIEEPSFGKVLIKWCHKEIKCYLLKTKITEHKEELKRALFFF